MRYCNDSWLNFYQYCIFCSTSKSPKERLEEMAMEKMRQKKRKKGWKRELTQNLQKNFDSVLEENPRQLAPVYRSVISTLYRIRAKTFQPAPMQMRYFSTFKKSLLSPIILATALLSPALVCINGADFCCVSMTGLLVSMYPGFAEILGYLQQIRVYTILIWMSNIYDRNVKNENSTMPVKNGTIRENKKRLYKAQFLGIVVIPENTRMKNSK